MDKESTDSDSSSSSWVIVNPTVSEETTPEIDEIACAVEEDKFPFAENILNFHRETIQPLNLDASHFENESESDGISVITDSDGNCSWTDECHSLDDLEHRPQRGKSAGPRKHKFGGGNDISRQDVAEKISEEPQEETETRIKDETQTRIKSENRPLPDHDRQLIDEDHPLTDEDRPLTDEDRPLTDEDRPLTDEDRPLTDDDVFSKFTDNQRHKAKIRPSTPESSPEDLETPETIQNKPQEPKPKSICNMLLAYVAVVVIAFLLAQVFKDSNITTKKSRTSATEQAFFIVKNDSEVDLELPVEVEGKETYGQDEGNDYDEYQIDATNTESENADDYENFVEEMSQDEFFEEFEVSEGQNDFRYLGENGRLNRNGRLRENSRLSQLESYTTKNKHKNNKRSSDDNFEENFEVKRFKKGNKGDEKKWKKGNGKDNWSGENRGKKNKGEKRNYADFKANFDGKNKLKEFKKKDGKQFEKKLYKQFNGGKKEQTFKSFAEALDDNFKKHENHFKKYEGDFKKFEADFKKHKEHFKKHNGEFEKHDENFKKHNENFKKHNENFKKHSGESKNYNKDYIKYNENYKKQNEDSKKYNKNYKKSNKNSKEYDGNFKEYIDNGKSRENTIDYNGDFKKHNLDFNYSDDYKKTNEDCGKNNEDCGKNNEDCGKHNEDCNKNVEDYKNFNDDLKKHQNEFKKNFDNFKKNKEDFKKRYNLNKNDEGKQQKKLFNKLKYKDLEEQEKYLDSKEKYLLKKEFKLLKKERKIQMIRNSLRWHKPQFEQYFNNDFLKPINKTVSGEWYINLHNARNRIRKEEQESDWLFDRANMRRRKRKFRF